MTAEYKQCGKMASRTPVMFEVFRQIGNYAKNLSVFGSPVYVFGETGTGKEEVAKALHEKSRPSPNPFVPVNCGAIPTELVDSLLFGHAKGSFTGAHKDSPGYFEQANGGTLFLDEVDSLQLPHQARLLRAVQEMEGYRLGDPKVRKYDAQVISASNTPLEEAVENGTFREDLKYRLKVGIIELPALRERIADIPLLANHFLEEFREKSSRDYQFEEGARTALQLYDWPGNIRELKQVIERILLGKSPSDTTITGKDVMYTLDQTKKDQYLAVPFAGQSLEAIADSARLAAVRRALVQTRGSRTRAAKVLDVNPRTIFRHIETLRSEEPIAEQNRGEFEHEIRPTSLHELERDLILDTLAVTEGNIPETARKLQISTRTMYRKLDGYRTAGIEIPFDAKEN